VKTAFASASGTGKRLVSVEVEGVSNDLKRLNEPGITYSVRVNMHLTTCPSSASAAEIQDPVACPTEYGSHCTADILEPAAGTGQGLEVKTISCVV